MQTIINIYSIVNWKYYIIDKQKLLILIKIPEIKIFFSDIISILPFITFFVS